MPLDVCCIVRRRFLGVGCLAVLALVGLMSQMRDASQMPASNTLVHSQNSSSTNETQGGSKQGEKNPTVAPGSKFVAALVKRRSADVAFWITARQSTAAVASVAAHNRSSTGPTGAVPYSELKAGDTVFTDRGLRFVNIGEYSPECFFLRGPSVELNTSSLQWLLQVSLPVVVYLDFWGGVWQSELAVQNWKRHWAISSKRAVQLDSRGPGLVYESHFLAGRIHLMGTSAGPVGPYAAFVCPRDFEVSLPPPTLGSPAAPSSFKGPLDFVRFSALQIGQAAFSDTASQTIEDLAEFGEECIYVRGPVRGLRAPAGMEDAGELPLHVSMPCTVYLDFMTASPAVLHDKLLGMGWQPSKRQGVSVQGRSKKKKKPPQSPDHLGSMYEKSFAKGEAVLLLGEDGIEGPRAAVLCPHEFIVTATAHSGRQIEVVPYQQLVAGSKVFSDREFLIEGIPYYDPTCYYIRAPNDDKTIRGQHLQWSLATNMRAVVFLDFWNGRTHAERGFANWSEGWTDVENPVTLVWEEGGPGVLYQKTFDAGVIKLFGNEGAGLGTYIPIVCPARSGIKPASEFREDDGDAQNIAEEVVQYSEVQAREAQASRVNGLSASAHADLVTMLVGGSLPESFNRCALIGSSAAMQGKGHGPDIDAHDTVIRVNRMPRREFAEDFGMRTDVLFSGPISDKRPRFTKLGMWYRMLGGSVRLCFYSPPGQPSRCPFRTLILKGSDRAEYGQYWEERYPVEQPGWRPKTSVFPIAFQSEEANSFTYSLLDDARPTNGFQAFVLFALMCQSLSVYGFSGHGTADGHMVSKLHDLGNEHLVYQKMIEGQPFLNVSSLKKVQNTTLRRALYSRLINQTKKGHVKMIIDNFGCTAEAQTFVQNVRKTPPWKAKGRGLKPLETCALVVPSPDLIDRHKGSKIDQHQWVFRVNRLPTKNFTRDFGKRTNILFMNCLRFRTGTVEHMGPPPLKCSDKHTCWNVSNLSSCRTNTEPGCSGLPGVIFRPGDCTQVMSTVHQLWGKVPFFVGVQMQALHDALLDLLQAKAVSTGLLAVFTTAALCKTVTLYGFSGTQSLHWHKMEKWFNLTKEHKIMGMLVKKKPLDWKFNTTAVACVNEALRSTNFVAAS